MWASRLRLNPLKTQHIRLCNYPILTMVCLSNEFPIFVFSTFVRDLGVILDQALSFIEQIPSLTRSSCPPFSLLLRMLSSSTDLTIALLFILASLMSACQLIL